MGKRVLKSELSDVSRRCALCGELLSPDMAMVDIDRPNPKADGGEYIDDNMRLLHPVCHMKRHGIHRERDSELDQLKAIIDDREQVRKVYQKVTNQLLAYKRRVDNLSEVTKAWLEAEQEKLGEEAKDREKLLVSHIKEMAKQDTFAGAIAKSALGVKGVGPVTVAYSLAYIDFAKADHASSLWAYAGLDKPSHGRYSKGTAGGGNKSLRTALYTLADSQVKTRGAYREVYDRTKSRLEHSEKIVKTRNTQGQLVEKPWSDTKPSHRHGAAMRKIMKTFLADLWYVGREIHGLPTNPLYAESMLGMDGHKTVDPAERGWVW